MGISGTRSFPGGWGVGVGMSGVCPGWVGTHHPLETGPGILQDTAGKRAIRILLECFVVLIMSEKSNRKNIE